MATGRVPTTANSPLTAKGDLFGYSTTQARVPVGSDGETLVADSSATTGLRWQGNFAAGKNKIINGDFGIWQRGTSFNPSAGGFFYTADRWQAYNYGTSATTVSQQTFTAGSAPVAGYEGQYFLRINSTNTRAFIQQPIEDVRTLAGQTVTVSLWAKSASNQSAEPWSLVQTFGSGGSATVETTLGTPSVTTSWQRFSFTVSLPSISGKTIGASNLLALAIRGSINNALDIWGVQVEAGNTATAFQTATGTLAGEFEAACRYYQKSYLLGTAPATNAQPGYIFMNSANRATNEGLGYITFPTQMRTAPTMTIYSYGNSQTGRVSDAGGVDLAAGSGGTVSISERGLEIFNNSGGTINAAFGGFICHYVASAEL